MFSILTGGLVLKYKLHKVYCDDVTNNSFLSRVDYTYTIHFAPLWSYVIWENSQFDASVCRVDRV